LNVRKKVGRPVSSVKPDGWNDLLQSVVLGASHGSLLTTKLLFAGHSITRVCLPAEHKAINKDGARLLLPVGGRKELVEILMQRDDAGFPELRRG
jgi:hypothetical protein